MCLYVTIMCVMVHCVCSYHVCEIAKCLDITLDCFMNVVNMCVMFIYRFGLEEWVGIS